MRSEDFSLWTLIETELQNRRLPTEELLNDFLLWICGMLLVVPGVVTDALGFLLLVPVCREELAKWIRQQMRGYLHRLHRSAPTAAGAKFAAGEAGIEGTQAGTHALAEEFVLDARQTVGIQHEGIDHGPIDEERASP